MGWSNEAPTLPSGREWGEATAGVSDLRRSNVTYHGITVRGARGQGDTYYVWCQVTLQAGEDTVTYNPEDAWFRINGESSASTRSPAKNTVVDRYYTGTGEDSAVSWQLYQSVNYTRSGSVTVGAPVALPLYLNDGGTIRQAEKVYLNTGGAVREGTVYINDGGTIRRIE